ncbi:hypothetical protein [Dictyobacter aurantiacus]|uniref:DUF5667 domain-containing protein n=1 Tax=Dictyobacter aurantiacus TaxID=1936993 RepID=A0A401ZB33_9CHLR|nr:hypothetical protein [Dictyobacter aurantiacus]GCE04075.1 hypothetical protein KDAU_14040 [Dictyobacter aurantiacus]
MKSQSERLNERLEEQLQARRSTAISGKQHTRATSRDDEEINDLLEIAQYLQSTPHTQVDNQFAQRLERRIRAHAIHIQQKRASRPWWQRLFVLRKQIAVASLAICLLLGAGTVAIAAQTAPPSSPLYLIKNLEHKARQALAPSQLDKAEQIQQGIRNQLKVLKTLANPAQEKAYNHELLSLEHQLHLASQLIDEISDPNDRNHANNELSRLKMEVNATLHDLLPMLNHSEQLATTNELNYQGAQVLHLKNATVMISTSPHPQATITITGESFQPGAQLFINNQLQPATGMLQNGVYIFTLDWNGEQQPVTIALRNPDDTLAQTTMITFSTDGTSNENRNPEKSGNGDNGSSNGQGSSNGGSNSDGGGNSDGGSGSHSSSNGSGSGNSNGNGNGNGGGKTDTASSKSHHK